MDHEQFEELLPAYLDGALNAEQTSRVEAWLAGSADARRALEEFRELDVLLESRPALVPPAAPFVNAVFATPLSSRLHRVMSTLFSLPGISGMLVVLVGTALFIYRQPITNWFDRTPEMPGSGKFGLDWLNSVLLHFSGADMWTMAAVYAGVTLLILGSSGFMLMRFLRD